MERNDTTAAGGLVTNPLLASAGGRGVVGLAGADVGRNREDLRRERLWRVAKWFGVPAVLLWWRILAGHGVDFFRIPSVDPMWVFIGAMVLVAVLGTVMPFLFFGRSPHVMYRPEQIGVSLDDVVGIDGVKDEVVRSLNLFLSHKTFAGAMGGTPRRGLLFEGAPGTGKTHTAKAMAREAGVPFLFVSATSFQSMLYGATALKIRKYFKAVRKAALAEGGAIAFIEEIDAIGTSRRGLAMTANDQFAPTDLTKSVQCCGGVTALPSSFLSAPSVAPAGMVTNGFTSEGASGVVNELLVQMQSFDEPSGWQKLVSKVVDGANLLLPMSRQLKKRTPPRPNVLVIAATNRADSLDPALLRPGRFDRALTFERPDMRGRRALLDFYLARKSHEAELDDDEHRNALASITHGYTPVMIEHLLDEALINAVRRGAPAMSWRDVEQARLVEEIGMGQPVGYTVHEKKLIATHEAGHATAAYLVAPSRRLEVLSIIKRREALGMLAHGDAEEVYTRSRKEMLALIQIAMAGQVAEELFFDDISTGPGGDLLYATNVAAQMVGAAGMAGTLVSFVAVQNGAMNDTNIVGRVLSDNDGRRRVEELLQEQKTLIKGKLEANQHLIAALRDALLERNELIGREITDVLHAAEAAEATPTVIDLRDDNVVLVKEQ
ncbi:MAG: cell division protease FtsH [Frankiaceae bacterium]|jgi:ATP-dependent Zn protease|nr:cell division protease FtsH [Frankiaceae bacterium]